jgi:hypothetical protein
MRLTRLLLWPLFLVAQGVGNEADAARKRWENRRTPAAP